MTAPIVPPIAAWIGSPPAALVGGALIGLAAALMWVLHGRTAGISGITAGMLMETGAERRWRLVFVLGLLSGGLLASLWMPAAFAASPASLPLTVVAGLLVGVGTTLANGCTSGHGVCGVGRLSKRSLIATCTFVFAGMAVVFVLRHLLGGAS